MIEKSKILEAWIMVEHLSEGNINDNDKNIRHFDKLEGNDYYRLFQNVIAEEKISKKRNGGIAVCFDVFDFNDVISILREKYKLAPTEEEIHIGKKFSLALCFDKELNFQQDMTFFTASGYIRYYNEVPHMKDFKSFEEDFKTQLKNAFEAASSDKDRFNRIICGIMANYSIEAKNCRLQLIDNLQNDVSNLHSFFIEDLEVAKTTNTVNLTKYIYGDAEGRVNLDSKSDSPNFNPSAFEDILKPQHYPLGRFPSNPDFALSFMQQVAVNLAAGYDDKTIRSVNGPPGTGKTTLLKDIFAQLIVQQSYDIAKMSQHEIKGTDETVYFKSASIGVLPDYISENNIIVASSNNGAVQNIVNELPLIQGQVDEIFKEELLEADYFCEIANSDVTTEWIKDDVGKSYEQINVVGSEEKKFWGLFSLEGGKKSNVDKILTSIKAVIKYFDEEYISDDGVYSEFLKQYKEVENLREQRQRFSKSIEKYKECCVELKKLTASYNADCESKFLRLNEQIVGEKNQVEEYKAQLRAAERSLEENTSNKKDAQERQKLAEQCAELVKEQKPGFFASKSSKAEYREKLETVGCQLKAVLNEYSEFSKQENTLKRKITEIQGKIKSASENAEKLRSEFENWNLSQKRRISELQQYIDKFKSQCSNIAPLDMTADYDRLQMSNPWFDEEYRIAQSRLFIKALFVRKQFLYENRKNIKAAVIIWGKQNNHLENKKIIEAAWSWINMTVPVISSTFASFSRMCKNLGVNTLGHLFVDEAGQAVPQAAVGAVFRSRHIMVVGDPSQIKPVLTLDSSVLSMLRKHFGVTEKYLSDFASVQTLVDSAGRFGFYRDKDKNSESWIGIPLWVHRRCQYPMFTISNVISYNGLMVQGKPENGKTGWFDVKGKANNKYVDEQGEFLLRKIEKMAEINRSILDKNQKDEIYVISPFSNVAHQLARKLKDIGFTRYENGKPSNVGTIHTFQGKEAPIVFMVLGADAQSKGAAAWAVSEANMMNVAATRAKKEFYIIGDKALYSSIGSEVVTDTCKVMNQYEKQHPELVDNDVNSVEEVVRIKGKINYVGTGKQARYAYVSGDDGKEYTITEDEFLKTDNADIVIVKDGYVSFAFSERGERRFAENVSSIQ